MKWGDAMDMLKKIGKFLFGYKKIIISVLILLVFIVVLAGSIYYITLDDGTYIEGNMSSTPYAASTYIKSIKFNENGIIFLYKHTDESTGEEIEEEKKSKEMAQIIWDEMIKEGSTVKNYLDSVDELEKLMNAEIITQYPKLDKSVDLNGTVEFERHKTDGTSAMLKYTDIETFNKYIEDKDTKIVDYFTLDENENLLIGMIDENTETLTSNDSEMVLSDYTDTLSDVDLKSTGNYSKTEYSVYSKTINYKNVISKYTMPFQYLWSLIVIGDDKGVGLELADLVNDSQIIISIYDNITTTVNTTTYTYDKQRKVNVSAAATATTSEGAEYTQTGSWFPASEWEDKDEYKVTNVTTYKNNTPIIDVTKADVWIIDYSKEYTYQSLKQQSQTSNEKDLEDTEYVDDADNPVKSQNGKGTDLSYYSKFSDKLTGLKNSLQSVVEEIVDSGVTVSTDISSCTANYYIHKIKMHQVDETTVSEQKYVAGNVTSNPKVEKKTEEEIKNGTGQDNFVTILCDSKHIEARKKITTEISSWLFELLESNPDTVNMVDLTKYLINQILGEEKYKGIDINIDSLYSVNADSFNPISVTGGDIDVSDESLFITDLEKLKQAFSGYSNSNKLIEHAQDFLDMQKKYKVNALFAAAVSISETGAGNAGNAIKTASSSNSVGATIGQCWNNWFNIKASSTPYGILYNGEGKSHYKIYTNVSDSIDNFGYNIAEGSYYYKQGKYTVSTIGHTYCPNSVAYPTQGDDWVEHTLTYMGNFYSAVGISIGTISSGNFVQYYQTDYTNVSYGTSTLAKCGCGPTSFAMIASTLTGQSITPQDAVTWCGNKYYVNNQGTSWSYFAAAASHFNLNITVTATNNINSVTSALQSGKYVISSQSKGLFTSGGHYIVLAGIDESNNIIVKDPNKNNAINKGYNNRTFTASEINQAAKQYWIFN